MVPHSGSDEVPQTRSHVVAAAACRLATEVFKVDEAEHVHIFARVLARHTVNAFDGGLVFFCGWPECRTTLL